MSLLVPPSQKNAFVQVEDIYIDSMRDKESPTQTNYDFVVRFEERFSNVIALEIPEYNFPINMMSQFQGANKIDFQLRNTAIYAPGWKTFVADLPEKRTVYHTPEATPGCTLTAIFEAFSLAILKDPDFGGRVDIIPVPRPDERLELLCRTLVYAPLATWPGMGSTECVLLFGTGANLESSAGAVLGFDQADFTMTDVTIDGSLFKQAISPREINVSRFSYLDIFIDQVPNFSPFTRIYIPEASGDSVANPNLASRSRWLVQPIRDMPRLTFRFRLREGEKPLANLPVYFTLRVFRLSYTHEIPRYAKNRQSIL